MPNPRGPRQAGRQWQHRAQRQFQATPQAPVPAPLEEVRGGHARVRSTGDEECLTPASAQGMPTSTRSADVVTRMLDATDEEPHLVVRNTFFEFVGMPAALVVEHRSRSCPANFRSAGDGADVEEALAPAHPPRSQLPAHPSAPAPGALAVTNGPASGLAAAGSKRRVSASGLAAAGSSGRGSGQAGWGPPARGAGSGPAPAWTHSNAGGGGRTSGRASGSGSTDASGEGAAGFLPAPPPPPPMAVVTAMAPWRSTASGTPVAPSEQPCAGRGAAVASATDSAASTQDVSGADGFGPLAPEDCTEDSEEDLDNDDSLAEEEDEEEEEEEDEQDWQEDWREGSLYRALVSPSWAAGKAAHPFRPPGFFAASDLPASTRASSGRSASMALFQSGGPVLGSPEMPTRGSAGHHLRNCKPCAFVDKGCESGVDCRFCHLCEPGEKKRRKKEKLAMRRQISKWRRSAKQAANRSNNVMWST